MEFTRTIKKLASLITAGAMLLAASPAMPARSTVTAASVVTVQVSKTQQTIRGFGGINHPEWAGDLTAAQRQTAFGNGTGELGMQILRVFVNEDSSQWSKAVPTAKAAIAQGALVFASPWNPPSSMCEKFTKNGNSNSKRLRHDKYGEYAKHLNNFVTFMKNNGVELYAISIQNEPDYAAEWTWWTPDECLNFMENYAGQIDCRVMSPETFQYNKEYYNKILNSSKAYDNTDLFGTHFYGTSRNNMDFPALEQCGKDIWMTEVYVPNSEANSADRFPEALQVSENIHNGLVVGNMNAYVWWYIRRQYGPMKEDGTISKRGYCMAQYSKFVRPGYVRVDATEQPAKDVYVSAYRDEKNQVVIVALNKSETTYTQSFSISGETIGNVDRYRTSANENLAPTKGMEASGSGFMAQLPANSVSTFVVTLSSDMPDLPDRPANGEPDENGYYFHDDFEATACNWAERGDATLELSGRAPYAGTNALLVSGRTASWNGAQKALNTRSFKPGTAYSFSACVNYLEGEASARFYLSLQYKDAAGETQYLHLDEKTAVKGKYVQLCNREVTIPAGATDLYLYVETTGEEDTMNYYLDEAYGAVAGTIIEGPGEVDGPGEITYRLGDVNGDGQLNTMDLTAMKQGILNGFSKEASLMAADITRDGNVTYLDAWAFNLFLVRGTDEFLTFMPSIPEGAN